VNPGINVCEEARSRALGLAGEVAPPPIVLHQNPEKGVVHIPSFFWADPTSYDGGPLVKTDYDISLPWSYTEQVDVRDPLTGVVVGTTSSTVSGTANISLAVRYLPGRYLWDFGDGARLDTGSLGQPFPEESDVQHVYERSSLNEPDHQYTYQLAIDWNGEWLVTGDANGGGVLPGLHATFDAHHEMRDVESVSCADDAQCSSASTP
jgi:hypothetical protein